jgi:hypothetical protein
LRGYYPGERVRRERPRPRPRRPASPTPIEASPPTPAPRGGRRRDWVAGILLGLILGLIVVAAFVFSSASNTIDAPSVSGESAHPAKEAVPITPGRRSR